MRGSPLTCITALLLGVLILIWADEAWALTTNNSLDKIVGYYKNNASAWEATLQTYALRLFWLLAGIEFTFAAVMLAFRGADLSEWLETIVQQVLFIGFFNWLLLNSSKFAGYIVESFRTAANSAAQANGVAKGMAPSDIFDVGIQLASQFVEATSLWSPGASLGLLIAALVIIVCFALIAAFMILVLIESYIVISAGVLFMGFGGSRWTKDFAVKIMVYAVSVGAKLFILQLIVALGAQVFKDLAANASTDNTTLFVCIGSAIVMLALTKIVPDLVQGLINGTSFGGGGALAGAAAGAVTGTATAAVGGSMAVRGASSLAGAQLGERDLAGTAPRSSMGRAAWLVGASVRNLGSALTQNAGDRLGGRALHGTRLGQTGRGLSERAERLRGQNERARKGQGGGGNNPQGGGGNNPQGGTNP